MVYTCSRCTDKFNTPAMLWKHLRLHDITTKTRTRIVCGQSTCKNVYYSGYSYKRHIEHDHQDLNLKATCNENQIEEESSSDEDLASSFDEDENELINTPKSKEELKHQIEDVSLEFINTLQSSSLPSSTVQKILTHTRELIGEVLGTVEETAAPILEDIENKVPPSEEKVQE